MPDNYATLGELKRTLELNGETFADGDLELAVSAASRGLDNVTRRRFWPDDDATQVRYFTTDDCEHVKIDDLVTLTSLATDPGDDGTFEEAWTLSTDFTLGPLNAAADGEPYTSITARAGGQFSFNTRYPGSIKVTGKFGWAAVPDGIKAATIILTSKLMRRAREAPFGVISIGLEGAAHIARTDPDIMFLVGPYIKTRIVVA